MDYSPTIDDIHHVENAAKDFLAANLRSAVDPDEIAAALRVIEALRDIDVSPLVKGMRTDGYGNPITDDQAGWRGQRTWSGAVRLQDDAGAVSALLCRAQTTQ